ncbi:MAG TPA: glycosyltransferase family 2 protein [Candidatus Woesebacteria bacterium]|nr:glycosyltransferase family 2 protein [Candidatus Woesebacteria bacterium]HNS65335.1 glycosyltransferase family 2 protein [Candidatus Woesebacteria bacterium]
MKLSVIVPVFNEEKTVGKMLSKLIKVADVYEVIVVDDGSSDNSAKEINKITSKKIQLFSKKNGGKGSAIRFGLTKVSGSHVLIQDADLEYDPEDIPILTEPVKKGKAEVVYGSRFLGPHLNLLYWHRVGNGLLNFLINILFNTTLSDMETCYKLIPTEKLRAINLKANDFDIEPEITCRLLKRGIRIYEVPISYVGRDHSQGKKITWRDGFAAVWVILRERIF